MGVRDKTKTKKNSSTKGKLSLYEYGPSTTDRPRENFTLYTNIYTPTPTNYQNSKSIFIFYFWCFCVKDMVDEDGMKMR